MGWPLSEEIGKECYGKPYACLACKHEEYFCIDHSQGPCYVCDGRDENRTNCFCIPDDEGLYEIVNETK